MTIDAAISQTVPAADEVITNKEPQAVNVEENARDIWKAPLDPSLYDVDFDFYSSQTGLTDPEELKQHIFKVQAEAFEVFPYPCIRNFSISKTKINRYPAYEELLKMGKERPGALLLDIGCGVGNDTRRAVADGFPVRQAFASDLHPEFWEIGHKLFKSTPESFPAKFVAGNIFEPSFLEQRPITLTPPQEPLSSSDIESMHDLMPLVGRVSAIHASSFFHLFDEEQQLGLAKKLASLLSPEPGSMIFGSHGGRAEKGTRTEIIHLNKANAKKEVQMFCHSPESWKQLWEEEVFGDKGKVEVWTMLREYQRKDRIESNDSKYYFLDWSVKRL